MLIKGKITKNLQGYASGTEVEVRVDGVGEQELMREFKVNFLQDMINDFAERYADAEKFSYVKELEEWYSYVEDATNRYIEDVYRTIIDGDMEDAVIEKVNEIYEEYGPKYYPVTVHIETDVEMYVLAKDESELEYAMDTLDAEDVLREFRGSCSFEYDLSWDGEGDPKTDVPSYETIYSADEDCFI